MFLLFERSVPINKRKKISTTERYEDEFVRRISSQFEHCETPDQKHRCP